MQEIEQIYTQKLEQETRKHASIISEVQELTREGLLRKQRLEEDGTYPAY